MLRVGTRGSKLALAQSGQVIDALRALHPTVEFESVAITTHNTSTGDKSRYVRSIEQQLRSDDIDVAVHSAKDVPGEDTPGLTIAAVPKRADPRDMLCGAESLEALREGAVVGTSSLRRAAQLRSARPDLQVKTLRGNIDTRLEHLTDGSGYDAIVLAAAGLDRLGVAADIVKAPLDQFVPAPGQGCLALQVRDVDVSSTRCVTALSDRDSFRELLAERAVAGALGASCNTPLGVRAVVQPGSGDDKDQLTVRAWLGLPDGSVWLADEVSGLASEAALLGHLLAQRILATGGDDLLLRAEELSA